MLKEVCFNQKVFVLGDSRTGTTSLHGFFQDHGLNSIHYYIKEAGLTQPIHEDFEANWSRLKRYYLDSEYQAFSDYPTRLFYKEIYELFPDAYFILSMRRSTDTWRRSMMRYFADRGEDLRIDRLSNHYERLNREIDNFFSTRAESNYLKVVIDDEPDAGDAIKSFLGVSSNTTLKRLNASKQVL